MERQTVPGRQTGGLKGQQISAAQQRERAVRLVLILDVLSLAPFLVVATLVNSLALYADWLIYLNSTMSNLLSWLTLRHIARGRDVNYDYGLGKMESVSAMLCTILVVIGLILVIGSGVWRLRNPVSLDAPITWLGVAEYVLELGFNIWLWRRNYRLARLEHSPLMETQWRMNRGDTLMCVGILVSLTLSVMLADHSWSIHIDPLVAILIAINVLASYLTVVRRSLHDLMDRTLEESLQMRIVRKLAEHFDDYEAFYGVRSRRAGGQTFIDIDLGFDDNKRVAEALQAIQHLTQAIAAEIPGSEVRISLLPPRKEPPPP